MPSYLNLRRKGYEFQIKVPRDLHAKLGGKLLIRCGLNTRDYAVAEARALQLASHFKTTFQALRGSAAAAADLGRSVYKQTLDHLRADKPEKYQIVDDDGDIQEDGIGLIGHEREGITYEVYSPHGLTMKQRREIVEKIKYPGLRLPPLPRKE